MKNYLIVVGSPVEYEELTADIVMNGKYIARLNKEEGRDKMVLEFFEEPISEKVYVNDFIAALEEAKELLLK